MADAEPTLDALRAEIDAIDDELHRLIMRRAEVALRIGALKNAHGDGGAMMRPGREALVLRRLVERHAGALPKAVIVRVWRELIAAVLRMQGPFSLAVYAPEGAAGYWDLARDQFGSLTPATAHNSAQQVLTALTAGRAAVAVLPLPDSDDPQPWWPTLLGHDAKHPRVVARLPFGGGDTVRGAPLEALAVAQIPTEPTGRDRTLLIIDATTEMSRSALADMGKAAGFDIVLLQNWQPPSEQKIWLHLVDVDGYVTAEDERIDSLASRIGKTLRQILPVGGYALPFTAAELSSPKKG
jgi:chorismate mutase / prephenate dehydratase